jgi:hypothetical protein
MVAIESDFQHTAKINDVSLDSRGDFVASCSDDGKVVVRSLYDPSRIEELTFDRPVKAMSVQCHLSYRPWPLNQSTRILSANSLWWGACRGTSSCVGVRRGDCFPHGKRKL